MARVHLKTPTELGGKDYRPGTHELPDSIVKDWYFRSLVKSGKAELFDTFVSKKAVESAPPAPASKQRHLEAGASEIENDDEIIEDDSEEPVEDFLESEGSEESDAEKEEKPKTKKKKKKSSKK